MDKLERKDSILIFLKKWTLGSCLTLAFALGLLCLPMVAQQPKLPFNSGEKLNYSVQWRLVHAGEAELLLLRDDTAPGRWKATANASSTGYVSNLFKVTDEYQSSFRSPVVCSNEIRKTINEGDRHRKVSLVFDQRRKIAQLTDRDDTGSAPPRQQQTSIPDCVHDIISILYHVRTQNLVVGQALDVPIHDGDRTVRLRIEVQANEDIKTPMGTYHTIRVEPILFSGKLFKEKGRMLVWLSNDNRRLPVQLQAQIGVGTITASLTSAEHIQ